MQNRSQGLTRYFLIYIEIIDYPIVAENSLLIPQTTVEVVANRDR